MCLKSEAGEENISSALCAKENAGFSVRETGKRERHSKKERAEGSEKTGLASYSFLTGPA